MNQERNKHKIPIKMNVIVRITDMKKIVERIRVMIVTSRELVKPVKTGIEITIIRRTYFSNYYVKKEKRRNANSL